MVGIQGLGLGVYPFVRVGGYPLDAVGMYLGVVFVGG